jgi:glycosyltransferase involved in cell wall biosynthesis
MIGTPEVTVVIPCFNQGQFIAECLESLESQTFSSWKAIVVEDASTDGKTPELCDAVQSDRVTVVHVPENQGRAGARNVGIKLAQSEAIMSLDADDKLAPTHFERTVPRLLENPRCGIVYTDYQNFGTFSSVGRSMPFDPVLLYVHQYIFAGSLFRKSAFEKTIGYRPEFNIGNEDWDFWLAIVEAGFFGTYVAEPLYHYRHHADSWTLQNRAQYARNVRKSRELLREYYRNGLERTGQLSRFNRDTEISYARSMLAAGETKLARTSLLSAMRRDTLSLSWSLMPWLIRSFWARGKKE